MLFTSNDTMTFNNTKQSAIYNIDPRNNSRLSINPNSEVRLSNMATKERLNDLNTVHLLPQMIHNLYGRSQEPINI